MAKQQLISQTESGQVDELKRRILAESRMIAWVDHVVAAYDQGDDVPSDMMRYRLVAGAAVSYFRQSIYHSKAVDEIDESINNILNSLWYDTIVGEVRCIQGLNKQTGRRSILVARLDDANDQLTRDYRRLSCRIGHGPDMLSFEDEWSNARTKIDDNIQKMLGLALHATESNDSTKHLRVINGGATKETPDVAGDDTAKEALEQLG